MEPQFPPVRNHEARQAWEAVLRPAFREVRAEVEDLSVAVVTAIRATFPALFEAPGSFEENVRATEANITLLAEIVDAGLDPREITLPPATGAFARAAVERGDDLTGGLRSLRLGHAVLWQHVLPRLREHAADADQLERAVAVAGAWSFDFIDVISVLGEQAYQVEQARWLRSASALQAEVIDALLSGEEPDVVTASRQLRYELARTHLAVVAWAGDEPGTRSTFALLEDAIAGVASALGSERPLVQSRGTHVAAGWLGFEADLAPSLDDLRVDLNAPGAVWVACGTPGAGIAGFRASHEQAMLARRVARQSGRPAGTFTAFPRVALTSLATADLGQAQAFVRSTLGALEPVDDLSRRLAATVQVYLEEDASSSRAARRLAIHENTVRYRLRQAEALLGRPVTVRSLDLQVALRIADAARGETVEA